MSRPVTLGWDILDRMERAVANVRERLLRAAEALNRAGVPYAVIGGNAVASWVATVDAGAVRNTRDVDILVRRADLPAVTAALEGAGFVRAEVLDVVMFLDSPDAKPSESIHLLFSGERVQATNLLPTPDLETATDPAGFPVLRLEELVRMKLTAFRRKDQVHIEDLIGVGLIDASWLPRLPPELAARLQQILDTPGG
jgi:hypothetical protein